MFEEIFNEDDDINLYDAEKRMLIAFFAHILCVASSAGMPVPLMKFSLFTGIMCQLEAFELPICINSNGNKFKTFKGFKFEGKDIDGSDLYDILCTNTTTGHNKMESDLLNKLEISVDDDEIEIDDLSWLLTDVACAREDYDTTTPFQHLFIDLVSAMMTRLFVQNYVGFIPKLLIPKEDIGWRKVSIAFSALTLFRVLEKVAFNNKKREISASIVIRHDHIIIDSFDMSVANIKKINKEG